MAIKYEGVGMNREVCKIIENWYETKDDRIMYIYGAPRVGKSKLIKELCREKDIKNIKLPVGKLYTTECKHCIEKQVKGEEDDKPQKLELLVIDKVDCEANYAIAVRVVLRTRMEYGLSEYYFIFEGGKVTGDILLYFLMENECVKCVRVYPVSMDEFCRLMENKYSNDKYNLLKIYLVVGGMPECVEAFVASGDFSKVRMIQEGILNGIYERISKKEKAIMLSVPGQLLEENVGFSYRRINKNAREREYGQSIVNLEEQGLLYKIYRFNNEQSRKSKDYKLYLYDVGLMNCLAGISERAVLDEKKILYDNNELLTRNYIVQEFAGSNLAEKYTIKYWNKPRAKAKLPFIMVSKDGTKIIPFALNIKKKADKSVSSFVEEHRSEYVCRVDDKSNGTVNRHYAKDDSEMEYTYEFNSNHNRNILLQDIDMEFEYMRNMENIRKDKHKKYPLE